METLILELFTSSETYDETIEPLTDRLKNDGDREREPLGLTYFAGYLLLSVATVRAGVFPRWCGWLLGAGVLLSIAAGAGTVGRFPAITGSLLMAVAFVGLAYTLWFHRAPAQPLRG
jgi:hypothetical protein